MDTTLIKFLIIWIMCENIVLTTSMALKDVASEDANTRQKRSPANNFSLFGVNLGNPVATARESFGAIGGIFSSNRGNSRTNHVEPYGLVRNTNTFSDFPSRSAIPNSQVQNDVQGDRYIWPQENKNEFVDKNIPVRKQTSIDKLNTKPQTARPEIVYEGPVNTADNPENGSKVDAQLLEYIFQKSQMNYDGEATTVNNNIDFVTETGEFETTTGLDIRLAPGVVASLLG